MFNEILPGALLVTERVVLQLPSVMMDFAILSLNEYNVRLYVASCKMHLTISTDTSYPGICFVWW